jgi:hypothetical protein
MLGKREVFLIAVVLGGILAAGCGDKKSKEASGSGAAGAAAEVVAVIWEGEYECKNGDAECRDDKVVGDGFYFGGTVFNTAINTDATVRAAPTKNGEVLFTAKKDTRVQVLGISKEGWVCVSVRDIVPKRGWIYGQYVDFKEGADFRGVKNIEMKVTDFNFTAKDSSTADITAVYEVNGVSKELKFGAFKEKGQKFYTFFYDAYVVGAHYAILPGLYTWDFAKNLLRHTVLFTREPYMSDSGELMLWKTVRFTDDKKFFFVGNKTEYGEIAAFRASDKKRLFDWKNYGDCDTVSFGFKNNTITTACPADNVMAKKYADIEEMDGAISEYGEEYEENIPRPSDAVLEILCEINLESGTRKITGGRWLNCE